ncbi:MAG TPA: squalene synthase HpnC [Solirubrobacteraceae bacterium]|nr:squalene synthase HpnC [Solirubrobacteraceae bacterium]
MSAVAMGGRMLPFRAIVLLGEMSGEDAPARAHSSTPTPESPSAAPHRLPPDLPTPAAVMARAGGENFPVASRVLPRRVREHLLALYGFARLVDELGDADVRPAAERLAALDWLEGELERAYAGAARNPLLVRLQSTVRECALPREPFLRLIEANRRDQRVARYDTWEQLLGYCHLSADPVGELVLGVFGAAAPERVALSDRICTALQLAEHWQDVAEDLRAGRIYLPAEDLERFGCTERDLAQPAAQWRVKGLIAFEVARTRELVREGAPLIGMLHGRERLAVAAFVSGADAALGAIERAGYDVLEGPPRAGRARRAAALARTLAGRRR